MSLPQIDTVIEAHDGFGNATLNFDITVAGGHSNLALLVAVFTNGTVSGMSRPGGGTWSELGAANGNGGLRGTLYRCMGPATGLATVTISFSVTPSSNVEVVAYSLYDVDPTTPTDGFVTATTGTLTVVTQSGDRAFSLCSATNDQPLVSGDTTSLDIGNFAFNGYAATHFDAPDTDAQFIWTELATGIALGINVNAVDSGAAKVGSMLTMFQ